MPDSIPKTDAMEHLMFTIRCFFDGDATCKRDEVMKAARDLYESGGSEPITEREIVPRSARETAIHERHGFSMPAKCFTVHDGSVPGGVVASFYLRQDAEMFAATYSRAEEGDATATADIAIPQSGQSFKEGAKRYIANETIALADGSEPIAPGIMGTDVVLASDYDDLRLQCAGMEMEIGHLKDTIEDFQRTLKVNNDHHRALENRFAALQKEREDWKQAAHMGAGVEVQQEEELSALRESLREAQERVDWFGGQLQREVTESGEYRRRAEQAEASLREQEELLQWAERVEEGITIQFEAREMTGVVAWTGEHVATTPTILAALRALRERVALCPERITPYEPKPPLHQI